MKRKIIKRDEQPLSLKEVEWLYNIVIDCVKNGGDGFTFFLPFDFSTGEGVQLDVLISKKVMTERDFLNE